MDLLVERVDSSTSPMRAARSVWLLATSSVCGAGSTPGTTLW